MARLNNISQNATPVFILLKFLLQHICIEPYPLGSANWDRDIATGTRTGSCTRFMYRSPSRLDVLPLGCGKTFNRSNSCTSGTRLARYPNLLYVPSVTRRYSILTLLRDMPGSSVKMLCIATCVKYTALTLAPPASVLPFVFCISVVELFINRAPAPLSNVNSFLICES